MSYCQSWGIVSELPAIIDLVSIVSVYARWITKFQIQRNQSGDDSVLVNATRVCYLSETYSSQHYNKRLDVEFRNTDFTALGSAMKKLDFRLVPPSSLQSFYSLVGGRYCSIQGKLAAQLKVKDKVTGKLATLYITPVTDRLANVNDREVIHDDVVIRLWKNEKTFYGLATDS